VKWEEVSVVVERSHGSAAAATAASYWWEERRIAGGGGRGSAALLWCSSRPTEEAVLLVVGVGEGGRKGGGCWALWQPFRAADLAAHTQEKEEEERERGKEGVCSFFFLNVRANVSLKNPNPSSLFYLSTYLFIYLPRFIFLRNPAKRPTFVCSHILNKIIILIRTSLV
jgi:hypothetical protein